MASAANETELRRQHRREQLSILSLVIPALVVVGLIILIPLSWLFYLSFLGDDGGFSLENYLKMTQYKSYYRIFITTFQVSILTTMICIALGYPLAFFLAQLPPRWAGVFMLAVLLPFWTSLLVRTYAWLVLLQRKGIINEFAMDMGFWEKPLKLVHNMTGTLIGMAHIMLPFLILPLYNAMRKIDRDMMHAAANLGANPVRAFWAVYFPLSLPGMVAGSLIVFVLCLGFYVTPAVLGGGRVIMVSNQITAILENQFDWGAASALGVVLLVATVLCLFLAARFFKLDAALFGRD
ncbi:Spermidine Putrescine ABC transporter permease component PotB [Candidatus Rhodobacter oscarellae]|uniref:Spermidine Putrescine ABC transporter permease component PotB n=1 Tax=Candidatus Rhodobacter oscarellae TaxID=1675527 RepID=A0A0J9ECD9_9RHOB|nr:ABC transporter permease [Candidatus Rhodobacter lobularis]KMW59374.1 Spermidine Putrescine ABC transporter permease component PotB [Candidatus Rhodobacter lobularis]